MTTSTRKRILRTRSYEVHVIGGGRPGLRDLYHGMLTVPWWAAAAIVTLAYLALNAAFAGGYVAAGGLANARAGSFEDAFYFSVQTMGTVGYGAIAPTGRAANLLVVFESIVGIAFTALATGLVFVRFSLQRPRVLFSRHVCIGSQDGVPTLSMRVGHERQSRIMNAEFRLSLTRTVITAEGVTMYRTVDLPLVRDHATALSKAWNVMHGIGPESPLHGADASSLAAEGAELTLLVSGVDDTSMQPVHATHTWMASDVVFGHRLADVVSEPSETVMVVDLGRFHDVVPVSPPGAG